MSRPRALALCFVLVVGCRRGAPPAPAVDAAVAPISPSAPIDTDAAGTMAALAPETKASAPDVAASAPAAHRPAATGEDAGGTGEDPATLPQTRDKPVASGPAFEARARALWNGITADEPERAMPFFFPLGAYQQVKAAANPAADWRVRLVSAYKRDIHALHRRLGEHASDAKLVRCEVPDERARWIEPGEEYNKLGYHRVYGTKIVYEVGGRERSFEVSSLISWRGEWFVVHLTGFK